MNVSDNIRAIRKEKSLTQTEVAKRYGTSPEFYHRLEKKDKTLTIEQLEKIADALEVSVIELLGIEVDSHTKRIQELESKNVELKDKLKEVVVLRSQFESIEKQLVLYDELFKQSKQRSKEVKQWAKDAVSSLEAGDGKTQERLINFIRAVYLSDDSPNQ